MRLTKDFLLSEFIRTNKGADLQEKNIAYAADYVEDLRRVAEQLQLVRDFFQAPVIVTSGLRCPELNAAVGGRPHSAHTLGLAADWHVKGVDLMVAYAWAADHLHGAQLIYERPTEESRPWIHLGLPRDPALVLGPMERLIFELGKWRRYDPARDLRPL